MLPGTFDLAKSPLEGFNLIDASAGTGKTYTICGLVLRLLLEKGLTIEEILVVTYTEAATEDLRDRIRQKLRQALEALVSSDSEDAFLQAYLTDVRDRARAERLLSEALRGFDEAAIHTIHGFCQRMLLENSFESNSLFDTELVADDSHLIKEIIEDYWRQIFSQSSELFSQYASDRLTPETLRSFLAPFLPHPFLEFIPAVEFAAGCGHLSGSETAYIAAYSKVCQAWTSSRREVTQDLRHSPALKRNTYNMIAVEGLIRSMDRMVAAGQPAPHLFEKFMLLTSGRIAGSIKKGHTAAILPFYEHCENLLQSASSLQAQYDRCLLALKKRLLDSFKHELNLRKQRDNVFSFDDLLRRLHRALSGSAGGAFARTIRQKYPAALIDEFQDTDPLQFEIFRAIYRKKSLLFLIGDPKQAIYSFRGADIFTYMDAAAGSAMAHHTLGVNHRSSPGLVKAVNAIFSGAKNPFIFDAISFQPVSAAQNTVPESFTIDGREAEPFILSYVDNTPATGKDSPSPPQKKSTLAKTAARKIITERVATEICRLLSLSAESRIRINDRALLPGDIAVLVRKNDEARKMQEALNRLLVPSVLHSGEDLFSSDEAKEMSFLLGAIAKPASIRRVKTALLTRFFGLQAASLNLLATGSPESETITGHWLAKCRTYHEVWNRFGFIQMFWAVMQENRVRQRLLASENGERSLTNILHLAEILHQEEISQELNQPALLGYLHDRLAGDPNKNMEHQLRLESDEDRVKIVTIHKAKGLEYPVVFCPFTWEGSRISTGKGCLFHRQQDNQKTELVFDAGSPELENHLQSARQEELAENIRLLYVALTRAVHRCYLFWGPISGAETSAPAYLLHQGTNKAAAPFTSASERFGLIQRVADRFMQLSGPEILADLHVLAMAAEGTIRISADTRLPAVSQLQRKHAAASLQSREFSGTISRDWKISSFSSLTAQRSSEVLVTAGLQDRTADRDERPVYTPVSEMLAEEQHNRYDIFSFPRGARSGTLLHELLEQVDFSNEQPLAEHLIKEKLLYLGYDPNWYPIIAQMLADLSNVRLHADIPGLKLASIRTADCLHELEFYFPLSRITPGDLKSIFCGEGRHEAARQTAAAPEALQLDRLTFDPTRGFMRGFIDLVFKFEDRFYLVDWKSNYLGPTIEYYQRDKLQAAMLSGFYFLQYQIYCFALHLYLEHRLPDYQYDKHFGGVFYIFLRGVNQALGPESGIYHDRPGRSTIEKLHEKLLARETS